ncbi:MAG TPA: hypothetical protein VGO39_02380 [Gaiellaceae bacterium]|nr:hypothetical protein [Gaiellaceae bacterium]
MGVASKVAGALALGAGFGGVVSLSNDVASPFGVIGARIESTSWASAAEVASLVLDAGWAWAGLAVAAGWVAGARGPGAVAGVLVLIAAAAGYYGLDSILRHEPFAGYWPELRLWWVASVVCGSALGAVGAYVGRPGVTGLLAGLTVPVGAAVQMVLRPLGPVGLTVTPAMNWARLIVWTAAAAGVAVVVIRFVAAEQFRRPRG